MKPTEMMEGLLASFRRYYDVRTEGVEEPFVAEASFSLHDEQYFLVRRATLSEADTREYIFFAQAGELTNGWLARLDAAAWERGLTCVQPHKNHRNSDVILVVLADRVSEEASRRVRHMKHYRSYRHMLWGWSQYRLVVCELSTGRIFCNRQGTELGKIVGNRIKNLAAGQAG